MSIQKNLISVLLLSALITTSITASSQTQSVVHQANTNPLSIRLSRQVPREYTPGSPLEIVLTIYCDAPDPNYPVTAVGLYETVPQEWTFVSMRGVTTEPPPIAPSPGTGGTLQFAWITPPNFPCTFAYTVQVPEGVAGVKTLSGQVEYRTNGPRLVSAPEITEINGIDRIPPEITLLGENPMSIYQGTNYVEPGWKAQDNADGDISSRVQVSGNVNTSQPGEYTLTYTVRDNAGNNASTSRLVRVLEREISRPPTTGSGTTPITSGPTVVSPPTTTPRPTKPTQTAGNPIPTSPPPPPTIPAGTTGPRPEEVTFPRPDMPNIPPNIPKNAPAQGIASGQPLKPFDIPKEIRSGAKPPPSFESNRPPNELAKQIEKTPRKGTTPSTSPKSEEVIASTTEITSKPEITNIQESKQQEKQMTPTETKETSASLSIAQNTPPLDITPGGTGGKWGVFSFPAQFKTWWAERTQAERRNLLGMFMILGLLTLLCIITGRTAYQGIAPQPRKKISESNPPAKATEK